MENYNPKISRLNFIKARTKALSWWNGMTFEEQFYKTIGWLKSQNKDTTERHPHSLTGSEIQTIHDFTIKANSNKHEL